MKWRVYNEINICNRTGTKFPAYFRTKKEAMTHAEKIGGDVVVEKKLVTSWVAVC